MSQNNKKISVLGLGIWLIAAGFFLYEFFLRTFVGTVAHQVIGDLHLTAETFALLGTAYFAIYGIMQIPVGILADKFGVKIVMTIALILCTIATFLFANSTGFPTAFISRLFMGFGSSFAFVCLLVIVLNWFPHKYFGFFAGLSQFIGTLGPLLAGGPLIALILKFHETWRAALMQIGAFGIILTVLTIIFVRNKPRHNAKQITYIQRTEPLLLQLRRLLTNPQVWLIALYSASVYVSIALLGAVWGTDYLEAKGFTQEIAAYMISAAWIGYAIGCPALGLFSDLIRRRKPALTFSALLGLISISLIIFDRTPNKIIFALAFFVFGIAAAGQNVGFAIIAEHVGPNVKSTALGLNNGMIAVFSAILPPLVSVFIIIPKGNVALTQDAFLVAFLSMPILYAIAMIISVFFIKETYCRPQKQSVILSK